MVQLPDNQRSFVITTPADLLNKSEETPTLKMGDDRQITDCEHYMRGNCRWGYDCLFRHPTTLHEPQVLCKFWQQYSCTNKFCQFLHPAVLPEVESVPTHHSGPPVQTGEPKSKSTVCAYYMSGRCSKPSCPFLHSLPEPISSRHPQQCKIVEYTSYFASYSLSHSSFFSSSY